MSYSTLIASLFLDAGVFLGITEAFGLIVKCFEHMWQLRLPLIILLWFADHSEFLQIAKVSLDHIKGLKFAHTTNQKLVPESQL